MSIDEIIEAWDKDKLPEDINQLAYMSDLVKHKGDYASHARTQCQKDESRLMYYEFRMLMVSILQDITVKIDTIKMQG